MDRIRPAAVSGSFYPAEAAALRATVAAHLARVAAPAKAADGGPLGHRPKLLVVPHAGYVYSGDVAANAYALLAPLHGRIRRIVLLGPTHRVAVRGLALPAAEAFDTPLGRVPIDRDAHSRLADLPQVIVSDRPHALEHSLEVQLPFLQTVLGEDFSLLPLAVGDATPAEVDEVLERLWGGDETLIVVSSDLSHYLPYDAARRRDLATTQRLLHFAANLHGDEACGAVALNGAMRAAQRHGLVPRLLDLRNSADTAGRGHDRVVGYAALAFDGVAPTPADWRPSDDEAPDATSDPELGQALLAIARAEIAQALGLPAPPVPEHPRLQRAGATFVTLHDGRGRLRGCVGCLEPRDALGTDVRRHALAAAFGDRRFASVSAEELSSLHIEVSVLGPLQPLPRAASADDAAALLRPGIDGVELDWHGHHGTLLPQVWAQLPERRAFLEALLQKAGLPRDFWAHDIGLQRYQVTSFEEPRHDRLP
ncbi:AmmeMemoRadiSam system protein B [Ideonella sp. A 288]|uniref:AmmeMemoRadiSam system protein B n=1 Tax=Ideonella sp. A 288 TaxID=1962181 RepID=UPI000B4BE86F|nr:AmmeMemoRadiSam system protein B [Ideonella sp. A 288]